MNGVEDKRKTADEPSWGLFINDRNKDLGARKSIKVKIPIRQHIKLHALKLFTENNISEVVERALDHYFEILRQQDEGTLPAGAVVALPDVLTGGAVAPGAASLTLDE